MQAKKNQYTYADSNPQSRGLELNALPTWPLHYIGILENYKNFITTLSKKILAAIMTLKDAYGR